MTANVLNFFDQADASGDNKLVLGGTVVTDGGQDLKKISVILNIGDISSANDVLVVPNFAGTITKITSIISDVITGTSALTFFIGGSSITDSGITIADAAAGTIGESTPSASNVITATDFIKVVNDGGSTNVSNCVITFEIELA